MPQNLNKLIKENDLTEYIDFEKRLCFWGSNIGLKYL